MFKKTRAYIKHRMYKRIIERYPFESKMDAFLSVISDDKLRDVRSDFDEYSFKMSRQERIAIIGRFKEDKHIEFITAPSNGKDIIFPLFKISAKGLEFLFTKGYTQQAIDRDRETRRSSETAFLNRLNILTGVILLISLLINVLYVFGVITWNLQDSTKNETEQQIHCNHNDRKNT